MGENSVKKLMTKADAISEIRLNYSNDIDKKCLFLIVEGKSDSKLARKIFKDNILIFESYSGKHGVVEIVMNECFREYDRLLGVCDRDYCPISDNKRILYYDCCCLEMMIVRDDEVFSSVYFEYYSGELSYYDLRKKIMSELRVMSCFRKVNEEKCLNLNLEGVSLGSAWNEELKTIDNCMIVSDINKNNPNKDIQSVYKFVESYALENWSEKDYYNNTQGHDFFDLLSLFCNSYNKRGIRRENLESSARCTYNVNHFLSTNLCKSICEYVSSIMYDGDLFKD